MDAELKRAAARGVLWNLAQNLVGRFASLVVVAILGRILDRSAFGVVALAMALTAVADLISTQGLTSFIVQRKDLDPLHSDSAFWTNVALAAATASALAATAEPMAVYFDDPQLAGIVRWLSLAVVIRASVVVPTGLLMRELNFRAISVRSVLASVVGGGVGIGAALAGWGAHALVAQVLVGDVLGAVALWFACGWRPSLRFSLSHARDGLSFGLPTLGAAFLLMVSRRFDTMVIADVLGTATLGVYAIAQRVFQVIAQVTNKSIDSVALSTFSKLADEEENRREAVTSAGELASAIAVPAYFGLMVVAGPAIELLVGPKWADAAAPLTLLALAGVVQTTGYIHAAALKAAGRTGLLLMIHVVITGLFVPALLLVVDHGLTAVAGVYAAVLIAVWPIQLVLLKKAIGLSPLRYTARIARPTAAACAMALLLWGLRAGVLRAASLPMWAELVIAVPVGMAFYVVALRVLAPALFERAFGIVARRVRRR